jgi:hypothetical protein
MAVSVGNYSQVFVNSPYVFIGAKEFFNRPIEYYLFNNQFPQATARAAQVIHTLLAENKNLKATFSLEQPLIQTEIEENIYLIINDHAVSLATEQEAPADTPEKYIDKISGTRIKVPTLCTQGHPLEWKRAAFLKGDNKACPCPVGPHLIGNLRKAQTLEHEIRQFRKTKEQEQNQTQALVHQTQLQLTEITAYKQQIQQQKQQIAVLQKIGNKQLFGVVTATGLAATKGLVKVAMTQIGAKVTQTIFKETAKHLFGNAAKATGKTAALAVGKQLPFVSVGVGLGLGVWRIYNRQYWQAGVEVFSGVLATLVPVWGPVASMALDTGLAALDVVDATHQKIEVEKEETDLNEAYAVLGINIQETPNPTKAQIDQAFRLQALLVHPDTKIFGGAYTKEQLTAMTQSLISCKERIYQANKWS